MIELKNQFIFAPIKLGYSDKDGYVNDRHIAFYGARSAYVGAVTIEPLYLDKGLREIPTQLGIDNDQKIDGLQKLVGVIHKSKTKVIAHLNHPGRMVNPKIPQNYFVSSTDKSCENGGATPKRMDREEIHKAIDLFVNAAIRAQKANFDIIELQFGHGYLLAQFISPSVNDREDEYGGNFESRIKFPLEVLAAVKEVTNLPIIVRISGDEMLPDGIKLPEMISFSKILEKKGVFAIHVSAGSVCSTPPWFFQHMFIPKGKTWEMAKQIKENISIPVIFVGRINSFKDIEDVKNKYFADYIAIGRALVADPKFLGKYLGIEKDLARPCLACSDGCLGGVRSGQGLQCVVNPQVGKETEVFETTNQPKRYAVVGGGLAGMESALSLKRRGHKVDLYEKDNLGGQFNLASLPPNKSSLSKLVEYYKEELNITNVNVIFKEASSDDLLNNNYDGVILTTGSIPAIPPIKGLKRYFWAEVLKEGYKIENKKVLVIGGGLIGLEISVSLLKNNNHVIIVEMLDELGRGMEMIEKTFILKELKKGDIEIYLNSRVEKIIENKVIIKGENNIEIDGIDHIIVSTGMKSYNPLEKELINKIPVYVVGDARKVGKAQDAIKDAYETAKKL